MSVKKEQVQPSIVGPRRSTLTSDTYTLIKSMIMNNRLSPDSHISIDGLARDLGVSPTPVREGLAALETEGLVVRLPLRGYWTTPLLTDGELADIFEMRHLVEGWSAQQAARLITPDGVRALHDEITVWQDAPGGDTYETYREFAEHDARFHDLILQLAGNEAIRDLYGRAHCHLHQFRLHYGRSLGEPAVAEHNAIVAAITAGDSNAAGEAMQAHLRNTFGRLQEAARIHNRTEADNNVT